MGCAGVPSRSVPHIVAGVRPLCAAPCTRAAKANPIPQWLPAAGKELELLRTVQGSSDSSSFSQLVQELQSCVLVCHQGELLARSGLR